MKPIYDIRQQIPQFSANYFEPYKYQPYPRMMVNRETGKPYLDATKKPIAVDSKEAEIAFWASKGIRAKVVIDPRTDRVDTVFEDVEAPVEVQKTLEVSAIEEPVRRGPGRPPMPKNLT